MNWTTHMLFQTKKQWENTFEIQTTTTSQIINANFFLPEGTGPPNPVGKSVTAEKILLIYFTWKHKFDEIS